MKTCTKCGQEQPLTNFASRGGGRLRNECRACTHEYYLARRGPLVERKVDKTICTKCGGPRDNSRADKTWCRACHRAYMREYHATHRDEMHARARAWKRNNPIRARELTRLSEARIKQECFALFGSCCQRCGFTDARALQIDHINGAGNADRKSNYRAGKALYAAILRGDKDRAEFQLLCANCNWIKRYENNECKRRSD